MATQPDVLISKERPEIDLASQAQTVLGAGRSAFFLAMIGAGWLGWGLGEAKTFNGFVAPIFGFTALLLLAGSAYFIRTGRLLRKKFPPSNSLILQNVWIKFWQVFLVEILAIALVAMLANRLRRADLTIDWCAMIAGLHFLPLARVFRAPILTFLAISMVLWCAFCWALFRADTLVIPVAVGTGTLLWASSAYSLLRAQKIAHSLRAVG